MTTDRRPRAVRRRPRQADRDHHAEQSQAAQLLRRRDARRRRALSRRQVAEDDDITVVLLRGADGVFSTGADMNNAYGWYGENVAKATKPEEEPAQPATAADRRPQVVRLLPQPDGLPEGHGRRDQRLRARRRLRDGADDRHLRDRPRHQDRHARHPLPRAGAGQPAHVLPPPRPGAGPADAADRRHHRGRRDRAPRRLHRHLRRRRR